MTYQVEFAATADAQLQGLPDEAFAALVDELVKVVRDPWGQSAPDRHDDDPAYRWAAYGNGLGFASFYVDEQHQIVRIYDVAWIG